MKLRHYTPSDRDQVLGLHQELQAYEWPLRPLRSRSPTLSEDYFQREYDHIMADEDCDWMFLVAEDAGTLVGYVFCEVGGELLDEPREQVQVLDIMVTESARGEGAGRKLMNEVQRFAAERGITRITLDVLSSNEGAIAFYKALGFEVAVLSMEKVQST